MSATTIVNVHFAEPEPSVEEISVLDLALDCQAEDWVLLSEMRRSYWNDGLAAGMTTVEAAEYATRMMDEGVPA